MRPMPYSFSSSSSSSCMACITTSTTVIATNAAQLTRERQKHYTVRASRPRGSPSRVQFTISVCQDLLSCSKSASVLFVRMCRAIARGSTTCCPCLSALTQQPPLWATSPAMAPAPLQVKRITSISPGAVAVLHAEMERRHVQVSLLPPSPPTLQTHPSHPPETQTPPSPPPHHSCSHALYHPLVTILPHATMECRREMVSLHLAS